jgi:hypothetical protein
MRARLANFSESENRLRRLFHVKHLLAEAKAAEKCIEDIFHTGAPGEAIERRASGAHVLGDQDGIASRGSRAQRVAGFANMLSLAPIECDGIFGREKRASDVADLPEQLRDSLARD